MDKLMNENIIIGFFIDEDSTTFRVKSRQSLVLSFDMTKVKMAANGWNLDISGVEETALLTLYTKAIESQSADPILKDKHAEALVQKIDPYLKEKTSKKAKRL